ncbi:MAG: inorganic pyrophosphatase [Myxococcales bacterium]|nr:inorganic pyrophosphatase [Myxococcales bacterium]
MFQAHPWHGVSPGSALPEAVVAFVEIVPTDALKYELDKPSGLLRMDRPQRYSNLCPTLYGFIPQTYCGEEVAARCSERTGQSGVEGDGDPMDVCILAEKWIPKGSFLTSARPIGGLRMVDANQADDKVVAVLEGDQTYGGYRELSELPEGVVDRLEHYFLTYKQLPGAEPRRVRIAERYGRAESHEMVRRSLSDYRARFGPPEQRVEELRRLLAQG